MRGTWGGLAVIAALLACSAGARAATIPVTTTVDGFNNDSQCGLREAVQAAVTDTGVDGCPAGGGPDTITLGPHTYALTTTGGREDANQTGDLDVTGGGALTISGAGTASTTIDAQDADRALDITTSATPVTLSDLTITNGSPPARLIATAINGEDGGALRAHSDLTLTNVAITLSSAGSGTRPASTLLGLDGGSGGSGGAIWTDHSLTVSGGSFSQDHAGNGGDGHNGANAVNTPVAADAQAGGDGGDGGDGGAIAVVPAGGGVALSLTNVNFSGDGAGAGGGAGDGGNRLTGQTVIGSGNPDGGDGGAGGAGGAVFAAAPLTIAGSTFDSSGAGAGGAAGDGGTGAVASGPVSLGGGAGGAGGGGGAGGEVAATATTTSVLTGSSFSAGRAGAGGAGGSGGASLDTAASGSGGTGGAGGPGGGLDAHGATVNGSTVSSSVAGAAGAGGGGVTGAAGGVGGAGGGIASGTLTLGSSTVSADSAGAGGASGSTTSPTGLPGVAGAGGGGGGVAATGQLVITGSTLDHDATGAGGVGGNGSNVFRGADGGAGGDGGAVLAGADGQLSESTLDRDAAATGGPGGTSNDFSTGPDGQTGPTGSGGGIDAAVVGVTITHLTVAGSPSGGGISGPAIVRDSIVAGNAGSQCAAGTANGSGNVSFPDPSCGGTNADPKLGPLAANGGPTETLLPGAGSAALDTIAPGGVDCSGTDQRGVALPQGSKCDSGAVEVANPGITLASQAVDFGSVAQGSTVSKTVTVSTTFDPLELTATVAGTGFKVTNDACAGTTIAPAASCPITVSFTASGSLGSHSGTLRLAPSGAEPPLAISLAARVVKAPVPVLGKLKLSPRTFRPRRHATKITFRLSTAATVKLTVEQRLPGRRRGRHCVAPNAHLARAKHCTRTAIDGSFSDRGKGGPNTIVFNGHVGAGNLPPGRYLLTATPTSAAHVRGRTRTAAFTIAR
jgi:CSLREA domain-containing protein